MVIARFAHEGAIVRLAFTRDGTKLVSLAEDRTIKVWRTSDYSELQLWENQPDVATALAFAPDGASFEVGRMDGSLASYAIPAAEPVESPAVASQAKLVEMPGTGPIHEDSEHEPNNVPGQANRLTLPASVTGAIDGSIRRAVRFRLLPLRGESRRAVGVRGERGPFEVEAGFVPRGSRRPGPTQSRGCSCRRCATRTSRSAARTTARPTIFASSTGMRCESTITCMPTARS